jgi:hypothetical protein
MTYGLTRERSDPSLRCVNSVKIDGIETVRFPDPTAKEVGQDGDISAFMQAAKTCQYPDPADVKNLSQQQREEKKKNED